MRVQIQNIILPNNIKHLACRDLFYRGDYGILDSKKQTLKLGYAQNVDFVTYFNAVSYKKWQTYTSAKNLTLKLYFSGEIEITLLGYHNNANDIIRKDFLKKQIKSSKKTEFVYTFPANDEMMVGFEITSLKKSTIYGGHYEVEVPKNSINSVALSLATTTYKKEDFIKNNINLISNEILAKKDGMAKNFYIHVVDNGKTLKKSDLFTSKNNKTFIEKHVFLHPNINAGGSGGYARGMLESLHQTPKPTHVLLMDDDVLVIPESIRRTYNLLTLLKPEYNQHFIAGAMLYYENPTFQHEDIGVVETLQYFMTFHSLKGIFDHKKLINNLKNESEILPNQNSYSAWWYCCIPEKTIEKSGLPLPLFIRADDMEYSLRNHAQFITMNGIGIWHMGFATKFNAAFDFYQQFRNWLIANQTNHIMPEDKLLRYIYSAYRVSLLNFNYDSAELIIMALEDYMKGPSWIMKTDGAENMQRCSSKNDVFIPLKDVPYGDKINPNVQNEDLPMQLVDRLVFKFTWNGQKFTPKRLIRSDPVGVPMGPYIQPQRITLHDKIVAVNKYNGTGVLHEKNIKKFRELTHRWKKDYRFYEKHKQDISKEWIDANKTLRSEKFWKKYLNLK